MSLLLYSVAQKQVSKFSSHIKENQTPPLEGSVTELVSNKRNWVSSQAPAALSSLTPQLGVTWRVSFAKMRYRCLPALPPERETPNISLPQHTGQ